MSQPSYGEEQVMVAQRGAGIVRVLAAYALGDVFPRLGLRLGITLRELTPDYSGVTPIAAYELRDLHGEVRLTEYGDVLGPLHWIGQRRGPRSGTPALEQQVETAVDLDQWRIERLERWRRGESPRLWLQLWPSLLSSAHGWYESDMRPFPFTIPRDAWLAVLTGLKVARFTVLEVPFTEADATVFSQAARHLGDAHSQLRDGRFSEAVGTCRLALDAMFIVLIADEKRPLAEYLAPLTDSKRAEQYAKLLSALKELTHLPHHTSSAPREFGRAEAVFVVQTTQHMLALMCELRGSAARR